MIKNVRLTGIEPARCKSLDPKSSASANSATGAFFGYKVTLTFVNTQIIYYLFCVFMLKDKIIISFWVAY